MEILLFPWSHYWWLYGCFVVFVLALLVLDLGIFHRNAHEVSLKEAATWSIIWISLAFAFSYLIYLYGLSQFPKDPRLANLDHLALARQAALQFLTGFIVEKSLAVDNIFVFVVVFNFFAIPARYQHRVLFYGILGALVFRAVFIALGSILMQYHWIVVLFGIFLLVTGVKVFFAPEKQVDPSKNFLIRLLQKHVRITPDLVGQKFFTRIDGNTHITPLFLALLFIELSDIIFAVDSVPAIFALTKEPFIVFTSNMFAILGLRAMFFLLSNIYYKFYLLKYGLGIVLVFVGLKMVWLNEYFGGKFPVFWSLIIISSVIGASLIGSLLVPRRLDR